MKHSSDVLVIGAGTAGLMCALECAARGLTVNVLEAAPYIGGSLHVSAGHMSAAGTRRQAALGIEDHPDTHFREVMEIGGGAADATLVRLAVDEAPRVVDWLEDQGFEFAPGTPAIYHGHSAYSVPRTYWGVDNGHSILAVLQRLIRQYVVEGSVRIHLSTPMKDLIVEDGWVRGALVGVERREEFHAEVTVLATGGYGSNEDLYRELTPGVTRLVTNAIPTAQGDGLRSARSLGAAVRFGELHTPRIGLLERQTGRSDFWAEILHLDAFSSGFVWVNEAGERFVDELNSTITEREHSVLTQPGSTFWIVFTESSLAGQALASSWDIDRLREEAALGDVAWSSSDPRQLAIQAGIDPDGLAATLERSDVAKTEPAGDLYAIRSTASLLCAFGGLVVDSEFRVMTRRGREIPGLRAIGEVLGMGATSGAAFCGGMAVTPALAFGRILGRSLRTEVSSSP